jgi:molecular chaperone GrpE
LEGMDETTKSVEEEGAEVTPDAGDADSPAADQAEKNIEESLKKAEAEAKETYDRLLRVSAEFDNYKKRSAREISEFRKFANESLLKELLPVVDNLERGISSAQEKGEGSLVLEGVHLTYSAFLQVLEKFGVKQLDALGKAFDPNYHQAVLQEEREGIPENQVIHELQKGYLLNGRLLRPAMVIVSKAKSPEERMGG